VNLHWWSQNPSGHTDGIKGVDPINHNKRPRAFSTWYEYDKTMMACELRTITFWCFIYYGMMIMKYCDGWLLCTSPTAPFLTSPRAVTLHLWNDPSPFDPSTNNPLFNEVSNSDPVSHLILSSTSPPQMDLSPPIILGLVFVALAIGILANGWISRLLSGDQGLASFLSDGSGYNKSSFKPLKKDSDRAVQSDPLPWLKLPELDFVEVAGQEPRRRSDPTFPPASATSSGLGEGGEANDESIMIAKLELIRREMQDQLRSGNTQEAERLRTELERLMNK
jgi:hypothetical protein